MAEISSCKPQDPKAAPLCTRTRNQRRVKSSERDTECNGPKQGGSSTHPRCLPRIWRSAPRSSQRAPCAWSPRPGTTLWRPSHRGHVSARCLRTASPEENSTASGLRNQHGKGPDCWRCPCILESRRHEVLKGFSRHPTK